MSNYPSLIERAFAMAESGQFARLEEIRRVLREEHFGHRALYELSLHTVRKQLLQRIAVARLKQAGITQDRTSL